MRAIHYRRVDDRWELRTRRGPVAVVELIGVPVALPLTEVYARLFPAPPSE